MGVSSLPEIRRPRFNHPENFSTGFGGREEETSKQCWVGRGRLEPVTRRKSRDETRSRRQVTRRDETRDVSRHDFETRPKMLAKNLS